MMAMALPGRRIIGTPKQILTVCFNRDMTATGVTPFTEDRLRGRVVKGVGHLDHV